MCKKSSIFAPQIEKKMRKEYLLCVLASVVMTSCGKPSRVDQYHAEKHIRDSVQLEEQVRSLAFYQSQLDSLLPLSDSLMQFFDYERNEKYQDYGVYVVKSGKMKDKGKRILVRDDGEEILVYKDGKRINDDQERKKDEGYVLAEHLQIVIRDISELEKRIAKTSMEIQKYQRRIEN